MHKWITEIPPRIPFSTNSSMSISVSDSNFCYDPLNRASEANPGEVKYQTGVQLVIRKTNTFEPFKHVCKQENFCLEVKVMVISHRLHFEIFSDLLHALIIFI